MSSAFVRESLLHRARLNFRSADGYSIDDLDRTILWSRILGETTIALAHFLSLEGLGDSAWEEKSCSLDVARRIVSWASEKVGMFLTLWAISRIDSPLAGDAEDEDDGDPRSGNRGDPASETSYIFGTGTGRASVEGGDGDVFGMGTYGVGHLASHPGHCRSFWYALILSCIMFIQDLRSASSSSVIRSSGGGDDGDWNNISSKSNSRSAMVMRAGRRGDRSIGADRPWLRVPTLTRSG